MRFSRDKRGYENTFVVHSERRRGRVRSRVLYWFRTPPGVKIGRSALDEDAIRLIEEFNPGVDFDWTRILKGQGAPTDARPEQVKRQRPQRARSGESPPPPLSPPLSPPLPPPLPPPAPAAALAPEPAPELNGSPETLSILEAPPPPHPVAHSPQDGDAPTPAHARLGSESVSRLRARHAEILARISEKVADPVRRDELKAQADLLNPDTWVTAQEVTAALEQYESVFAALRGVVGRGRRRRSRGRAASSEGRPPNPAQPEQAGEPPDVKHEDDDSGSEES